MWDRIRNARLFRVFVVYLGAAWVVLQVTETIQDGFNLPDWVMPFALVLLLVGFIVVMGTALVQAGLAKVASEGRPGGWSVDLKDLASSLAQARVPHLTWGRAVLGGVVAFSLLFGLAGAYVLVTGEAPSLPLVAEAEASPLPGFAVLPFRVTGAGEDMALMREGMVDLLSTNLEGVAGLRKTDPTAIISRWRKTVGEGKDAPSAEVAYDVARDLGAWYAITGTLVGSGNQVRAGVEVYDTREDVLLGSVQVDGSPDDILSMVDRLSLEILQAGLVPVDGGLPHFDVSEITTGSLEALRAYLEGEQLYRRSRWPEAITAFDRAIAADSTFAMAWYRRAQSYSWLGERFDLVDASIAKALEHSGGLKERERLLINGVDQFDRFAPEALQTLERLTHSYPDDVEGWAVLGDAYLHIGGPALVPADRFRSALRRAIELDPTFGPAYVHLIEDSFSRWDSVGTRALIDEFARIDADTPVCGDFEWAYAILWGDEAARAQAIDILEREGTARPACSLYGLPATPEFLSLLEAAFEDLWRQGVPQNAELAGLVAWKAGHVRDARRIWALEAKGKRAARLEAMATVLTYADPELQVGPLAALEDDPAGQDYSWLTMLAAQRGDFTAADDWIARQRAAAEESAGESEDQQSGESRDERQRAVALTFADADAGYVAIRRGNVEAGANQLVDALARLVPYGAGGRTHSVLRFELGKALLELDRPSEAAAYLETFDHFDGAFPVMALLYKGHAYAALGEIEKARQNYELFTKAWSDADPELVPLREEAETALAGLQRVAQ